MRIRTGNIIGCSAAFLAAAASTAAGYAAAVPCIVAGASVFLLSEAEQIYNKIRYGCCDDDPPPADQKQPGKNPQP